MLLTSMVNIVSAFENNLKVDGWHVKHEHHNP